MKRLLILTFFACLAQGAVLAQHNPLVIQGAGGKFFLLHIVEPKENWYSLGRLYNLPPKDIAAYNGLEIAQTLEIKQPLNIPLTNNNFDQKKNQGEGEALIPVYHTVQDREWMFKLSSMYNDVPVTSLEKWNGIKRDQIKQGMPIVIGYLRVKTDQSPLGAEAPAAPTATTQVAQPKPADKSAVPATGTATSTSPAANVSASTPTTTTANTGSSADAVPANTPSKTAAKQGTYANSHPGGFFMTEFLSKANKSLTGQGGTFKSTSGWTDGKYYVLINDVPKGTIVKINANGKTIYAKVLGDLPEMKESSGLLAWVSNAGSTELGSAEGRFAVEVDY